MVVGVGEDGGRTHTTVGLISQRHDAALYGLNGPPGGARGGGPQGGRRGHSRWVQKVGMGPGGPGLSSTTPQGGVTAIAALLGPRRDALCSKPEKSKRLYQHLRHTIVIFCCAEQTFPPAGAGPRPRESALPSPLIAPRSLSGRRLVHHPSSNHHGVADSRESASVEPGLPRGPACLLVLHCSRPSRPLQPPSCLGGWPCGSTPNFPRYHLPLSA